MLVSLALLSPLACGTSESDDEVAEVTSVDDTADLDGTSTSDTTGTETSGTSTETGDTTETTGNSTFEQLCSDGCMHFLDCAPTEFSDLYADIAACESGCEALYANCTQEASEYFYCFLGLQCDQVLIAVTDGPDATECGGAFEAANAACG